MYRKRFHDIEKYLHLADNQDEEVQKDPIGKVREFIDILNQNF